MSGILLALRWAARQSPRDPRADPALPLGSPIMGARVQPDGRVGG